MRTSFDSTNHSDAAVSVFKIQCKYGISAFAKDSTVVSTAKIRSVVGMQDYIRRPRNSNYERRNIC